MNRRAFVSAAAACSVVSASSLPVARAQSAPRFADAIRYSADQGGASLLVVRNGLVLAEDYPGGAPDTRWPTGEGTRVMMPLLIGALVSDRLLRLDDPAALTLGAWGADARAAITIRTLLDGTSGLAFGQNDTRSLATALALQPAATPGFICDAAPYFLLTEIARRKLADATGDPDPAQYLTDRVLGPIGCIPVGWMRGDDGPRFDDGGAVSARGWAVVGELVRRAGVWRAEQLVDAETLREAVRGSVYEPRAGAGLWLAAASQQNAANLPVTTDLWRASSPAPIDLAMAAGAAGQRLYIALSAGVVVARQTRAAMPWSDARFLTLLWRDL
jgi:hypothetical protein